jgi:D-glycero-D-manno-heptose 1,7-bisphosphate phosphatase
VTRGLLPMPLSEMPLSEMPLSETPPSQASRRPALFLDRDGIINVDHGYVHRSERFEFMPGIFELARYTANELRWPIVVVTNQAGIGRGLFDEADFQTLTRWMCERFAAEGAPIASVYHCPYHPEHGIGPYRQDHPWRKPRPGMILQAAADLALDLPHSAIIGDAMSDIEAGAAAGVALRIRVGTNVTTPDTPAHHVAADLTGALDLLRTLLQRNC